MRGVHLTKVKTDQQILEVSALAHVIWREYYTPIIGADQVEYMLETLQSPGPISSQMGKGYDYYIVRHAGVSVGYTAVRMNDPAPDMFLSKLYILSEWRGRGYARAVLAELDDFARKAHQEEIWLTVNRSNPSAETYKRLGFETREERVTDIGGGYVMDDYIMYRPVPKQDSR